MARHGDTVHFSQDAVRMRTTYWWSSLIWSTTTRPFASKLRSCWRLLLSLGFGCSLRRQFAGGVAGVFGLLADQPDNFVWVVVARNVGVADVDQLPMLDCPFGVVRTADPPLFERQPQQIPILSWSRAFSLTWPTSLLCATRRC